MQLPEQAPFTPEQRQSVSATLATLTADQATWLSGFLAGTQAQATGAPAAATAAKASKVPLTILYGTESGNCEELAAQAKKFAEAKGFTAKVKDMGDIKASDLAKETNLAVIVSTWGEGDPPDRATKFHTDFMGEKMPKLDGVRFSVLALGDTAYEQFCKIGKDFDARLEELGAKRFHKRTDCDVDYDDPAQKWIDDAFEALAKLTATHAPASNGTAAIAAPAEAPIFGKKHPFPSELKERILLNGTGSIKETWHLEFELAGSGMTYEAGDALALIPTNAPEVVDAVLKAGAFDAQEKVTTKDGSEVTLREALAHHYDITGLTKLLLKKYNDKAQSDKIAKLLEPEGKGDLHEYTWGREVVDMLEDYPVKGLSGAEFISVLRKMPPRLYSIASSIKAHPDEVHLTIAAVRYHSHGRDRKGVASTYIADDLSVGGTAPIYTHANKNFKLPADPNTPMIMVGPGTGIAPFRAFVEDRAADGAKGKNWLVFGDQRYSYDFLYQLEWQDYLKSGVLDRLDLAFSRDQPHKVYVQDRILANAKDIYAWLDDGAHFYVCGDATRMAGDVQNALVKIAQDVGGKSEDEANAWIDTMKKEKRYQRDVY